MWSSLPARRLNMDNHRTKQHAGRAGEIHRWCDRHWEPYRSGKHNGLLATMLVVQMVLGDERFMRACGWDPENNRSAKVDNINVQMDLCSPLCCFLGDEMMGKILGQSQMPKT